MKWKEKMPAPVRDKTFAEYGSSREERPVLVDCALGTNPLGSPPWAKEYIKSGSLPDPGGYPGDDLPLRKALSDSWNGAFFPDEIVTGTGSIGLIISLAGAFCAPGATVLGIAPQFPDGPMHFQFAGASYRYLPLTPPEFDLDISRLLGEMTGDESLVYVDRPHNPTGQVPPLAEMALLADGFWESLWADWSPGYDPADDITELRRHVTADTIAGVINPYRASFNPEFADPGVADEAAAALSPPPVSTLYLHGATDGAIGAELLGDVETYLPALGSAFRLVDGVGHFLHLEKPEEVAGLIRDWLG